MTASGDYTLVSSDIYVYDRETLEELAYVAYDSAESVNARASIWCIYETGTVPAATSTVASSDIEGFDVDIESPMLNTIGGFYFVAESGDLNASISSGS